MTIMTAHEERLEITARAMRAALEIFLGQWNACGPNSEFGRYFSNTRDAAVAAALSFDAIVVGIKAEG